MTPCKPPAPKSNLFYPQGCSLQAENSLLFSSMEETAIISAIQKLIESGSLEKLDQPGAQTFVIYALLIILAILCFRLFVINGWLKKGIERFFELEELKVKHLETLNTRVIELQKQVDDEHRRLADVMNVLNTNRRITD